MKTKIVYVLSSDDNDYYLEQTYLSVYSLRQRNNDVHVVLVVDQRTDATLKGGRERIIDLFSEKVVVNVPNQYNKAQTSRYLKTSLGNSLTGGGNYLYIDSDTVIADSLDGIDSFGGDIGAVLDCHSIIGVHVSRKSIRKKASIVGWKADDHVKYFNSGVMFVRDNDISHRLYEEWHHAWKENLAKTKNYADQPTLALANEKMGYPIQELDGSWNCQILYGIPYLHNSKIIHYLGTHVQRRFSPIQSYKLSSQEIFKEIKETGTISSEVRKLLDNPRGAFNTPVRIAYKNEIPLLASSLAFICIRSKRVFKLLNAISSRIIKISKCFRKK